MPLSMIAAAVSSLTPCGDLDHAVGGDQPLFGIGADRPGISDAAPDLQVAHALADRGDDAGPFHARDEGKRRLWVEAGAVIDVDEVEPDRRLLDLDLAGAGLADLDLLPFEDFGPAIFMHPDRVGHSIPSFFLTDR